MLLTEPVATAASWFCRGGYSRDLSTLRARLYSSHAIITTRSTKCLVTWFCNLKKKRLLLSRLIYNIPGVTSRTSWVWCIPFTSGVCHQIYADNVSACWRATNHWLQSSLGPYEGFVSWKLCPFGLTVLKGAFERGWPFRFKSEEVNLQRQLPKDTTSELEHNIRL